MIIFVAVFQMFSPSWPHGEPQLDLSKNTTRQLFVSNIWSKIKYFLYRIYLTFSFCYTGLETALHVWRIPPRFFLTSCTVADSNRACTYNWMEAMNPGWLQAVLLKMTSSHHAKHSLCYSCVTCTLQHGLCNVKCALFFPCAFCGQPCPQCASSTRSDARSGSKIAAMHLRLIFMKGFSANLTFESAPKNIGTTAWKKNKIFSFCAFASAAQYHRLPACDQTTKVNHHQNIIFMVDPSSQTLADMNLKCLHQKAFLGILPGTLNRPLSATVSWLSAHSHCLNINSGMFSCAGCNLINLLLIFVKSQIPQNTWEHRLSPCSDLVIQSKFCFDKKGQIFSASGPTIICEYDALLSKADVRIFAKFTAAFTNFGCATKLQCFRGSILASFNIPQSGTRNSSSSSYLHIFCSLL